jgi:dienelactone hydrolase
MPGSGPTDRDGNQPPMVMTNVLKQIAEHLAKNGIATFRFDKRPARKYVSQWPKTTDMSVYSEYFSFENHVADVESAYKAMLKQPKVDAGRTALLGHSEGGLFASWQAPRLNPKALVLCGTAGDTMVSVIRFQVGESVRKATAPQELKDAIIASNEETMKTIVETGKLPANVHPNLAGLYNAASLSLIHSYLTIDPIEPLKKYTGPVLVLNGEKDAQIRATVDAKRLFEAASSRNKTKQELAIIAGASHNLKVLKDDKDPGFEGPVAPEALEKITAFLKAQLASAN